MGVAGLPFRDCCANRSLTGVDACSLLLAITADAVTWVLLLALFTLGMPRFSARLLAMEDCGSLRREDGGVDDVAVDEEARGPDLGGASAARASGDCFAVSPLLSCFRGASLIRPASLRWWSSRRPSIRRAYPRIQKQSPIADGRDEPRHCACLAQHRGMRLPRDDALAPPSRRFCRMSPSQRCARARGLWSGMPTPWGRWECGCEVDMFSRRWCARRRLCCASSCTPGSHDGAIARASGSRFPVPQLK